MEHFAGSGNAFQIVCLVLAMAMALGFEFVNGFHDTANAVATVIYTHSLPPWVAVIWSGLCNLAGVMCSEGGVAFGIVSLLPTQLVMDVDSSAGFAMVFSLLISAIIWNLGTWYLGLPASSSHSLIGSIMGVGMMNSLVSSGSLVDGINWAKAQEVGLTLLVSPIVGFGGTALLFLLLKKTVRQPELYSEPHGDKPPPSWIRGILCLTCTGVSATHGSNDGQKGMGLIMLILVGIIPASYALNLSLKPDEVHQLAAMAHTSTAALQKQVSGPAATPDIPTQAIVAFLKSSGSFTTNVYAGLIERNSVIETTLGAHKSLSELSDAERNGLRKAIFSVSETIGKLNKIHKLPPEAAADLLKYKGALDKTTKFIPFWVKLAVALALGFGTMIGWKRIVVTVGEKIGKTHLTYGQGAAAELVAMITIGLADKYALPVSTTHVLSSGVAGAMAANKSGVQLGTLRNLLLAWVLTLPATVFLGAAFFAAGLRLMASLFGVK